MWVVFCILLFFSEEGELGVWPSRLDFQRMLYHKAPKGVGLPPLLRLCCLGAIAKSGAALATSSGAWVWNPVQAKQIAYGVSSSMHLVILCTLCSLEFLVYSFQVRSLVAKLLLLTAGLVPPTSRRG